MNKPFEEFNVHKKGVILTRLIFNLVSNRYFENEIEFKNQLKSAVLSITNNIAKGSECNDNNQFIAHLKIAKENCIEVKNMLVVSKELNFCNHKEIQTSYELTVEIADRLFHFIKHLEKQQ